jgi:CysZ protein
MQTDSGALQRGPAARRPGLRDGFASLFFGFGFLVRRPAALPFALVPMFWFSALSGLGVWASVHWVLPAVQAALPVAESGIGQLAIRALSWVAVGVVAAVAVAFALFLAPPLSAPALERLVALVEAELGIAPRPSIGWAREMWLGLKASVCGLLVFGPVLALLSLVDLLLPPAALFSLPLRVAVASVWLSYTLFDYPQSLRGYPIRERLRLLRSGLGAALGFGLACSALFWLPCVTPVVLPAGVIAATRLFWRIVSSTGAPEPGRP